jgi:hypothetical protein
VRRWVDGVAAGGPKAGPAAEGAQGSEPAHVNLMLALAHAAGRRLEGAGVKGSDNLFRAACGFDQNNGYSTRLERFNGARADSAAQYGLTTSQRIDKSGVTGMSGGAFARSGSVPVTTCIGAGLDESHLSILGFEDEELPAAPKVGGDVDSIVRRYSDLHV